MLGGWWGNWMGITSDLNLVSKMVEVLENWMGEKWGKSWEC